MNRRNNYIIGLLLIALGGLFLLKNTHAFGIYIGTFDIGLLIKRYWPLIFFIIPGLTMHISFFSGRNRDAGILVPGGIFLVSGITGQLSVLYKILYFMWPGFLLAVAIGLFELYMFGNREKALLIPVCILAGLSAVFFSSNLLKWVASFNFRKLIIPVVLIVVGISVIIRNNPFKRRL